jgi:biopolymer transport protein ExbD
VASNLPFDGSGAAAVTQNDRNLVAVTVDKFSKYEIVAQALADLQHRGLKKIGFVNNDSSSRSGRGYGTSEP